MRVLFVSDFSLAQNSGGAQQSNDIVIRKGEERGHEITLHTYESSSVDFLSHYDVLVSSNLEQINRVCPEKLDFILKHPHHIRYEHDSCLYFSPDRRQEIFESTKLSFFSTNFHISRFKENYGDYFKNFKVVYEPINTEIFTDEGGVKIYDVIYCGYLHPLKGLGNLLEFAQSNPNREISVFGWGENNIEKSLEGFSNIEFHGHKNQQEIANVLKQCKAIYHHPIVDEPFCRMIAEGLLCGVEEIIGATDRIGAYLEFVKEGKDSFRKKCATASDVWWDHVEKSYE
tara:strand:- start:966 stop:1823 length:858 start_codon:yes stop_codon:yes gene_type:complete